MKTKLSRYLFFIFFLLIAGCSSSRPIIHQTYQFISEPELNTTTTVGLGDEMLNQYHAHGFVGNRIELSSAVGAYSRIEAGIYCQLQPNSNLYMSPDDEAVKFTSPNGQIVGYNNRVSYDRDKQRICPGGGRPCYDSSEISIVERSNGSCLKRDKDYFQRIIEYSGKNGNILTFVYREFANDMIRSGFTTNFTIDLSEGDTLTYKGSKIKIEDATNNQITYKVLKNFKENF
jgi:hypothetical protein